MCLFHITHSNCKTLFFVQIQIPQVNLKAIPYPLQPWNWKKITMMGVWFLVQFKCPNLPHKDGYKNKGLGFWPFYYEKCFFFIGVSFIWLLQIKNKVVLKALGLDSQGFMCWSQNLRTLILGPSRIFLQNIKATVPYRSLAMELNP
jgi:hypothetical protein